MKRLFLAAIFALWCGVAAAQTVTGPFLNTPFQPNGVSAPAATTVYQTAAQSGVLLDTFRQASDTDDTASLTRAVAAGVPILLGPRTYLVHDFSTGIISSFVLRGIPGQSIIQRDAASGGTFFGINAANVVIDGVTFDMNSGTISANQWGVLLNAGGQTVTVKNSVFKNNSGSLGIGFGDLSTGPAAGGYLSFTGNEITNCTFNDLYLGSLGGATISGNYIHDTSGYAIYASSNGTVSSTNYLTNVTISDNKVFRAGQIAIGGYPTPYTSSVFSIPPATHVTLSNNTFVDDVPYALNLEGDYIQAIGNHISNSNLTSMTGAIDVFGRYTNIQDNVISFTGINFAIDVGGSIESTIQGNTVSMNQGSALNTGGNLDSLISGNHLMLTGTAYGITNYAIEGSGSGSVFPTVASSDAFQNNTFDMTGSSTRGIGLFDNAGGSVGAVAMLVRDNHFNAPGPNQAVTWYGNSNSLIISGNDFNGRTTEFVDPNGNGDVVFDTVYFGDIVQGVSSTTNIRSIIPAYVNSYGSGGSILWVTPSAGGSGYTAATTLAATGSGGGSGWTGVAQIVGGAIIGVKTTSFGSGYSGTITVSATDSGGGTGATFTVGNVPDLPNQATIQYISTAVHFLQRNGGYVGISGVASGLNLGTATSVLLQTFYGTTAINWRLISYTIPTAAVGSLPACNATTSGSQINVSGSVTNKWQAQCNGTNWIWPDGTTVSN